MSKKLFKVIKEDEGSLRKRYLFWLYKTTKDELDKVDRKFTQLSVDFDIQKLFEKWLCGMPKEQRVSVGPYAQEWKEYIFKKESDSQKLKFNEDGSLSASYLFLQLKLEAICHIIKASFGVATLKQFKRLYEEASMKRILEDVSGKR